jgi:hypothetical protein
MCLALRSRSRRSGAVSRCLVYRPWCSYPGDLSAHHPAWPVAESAAIALVAGEPEDQVHRDWLSHDFGQASMAMMLAVIGLGDWLWLPGSHRLCLAGASATHQPSRLPFDDVVHGHRWQRAAGRFSGFAGRTLAPLSAGFAPGRPSVLAARVGESAGRRSAVGLRPCRRPIGVIVSAGRDGARCGCAGNTVSG